MESSAQMTTALPDAALIEQLHALEQGAAYRACPELAVVYVRGDDRTTWLNGQLTNDIREIPPGQSVHALAVNVRGKIMAELIVADLGEAYLLLVDKQAQAALLESFERYIIMEDVTIEAAPDASVVYVDGAYTASEALTSLVSFEYSPLARPGRVFVGDQQSIAQLTAQLAAALPQITEAASEIVRLRRAIPRFGRDFDDHNYPQETGLKALVSFKKGCYLGQEVVCTLENRGKLSRHLCVLETPGSLDLAANSGAIAMTARPQLYASAEAAGSQGPDAAGAITSAVWDPEQDKSRVLAYVRRAHALPGATLFAGPHALTLVRVVGEDAA
jgi:tRNA-modifying protein YgfZ